MKKCIVFARVSTTAQSLDEQLKELQEWAIRDGYSYEQQYKVDITESAIKNVKEEARLGLQLMKEYIEMDSDIDCVYIWEISRWSRYTHILHNMEFYLTQRKINLKSLHPNIELLNPDGTINSGSKMVFAVMAEVAEQEMRLKVERFKRAKRERKREGFRITAKLPFGYSADEHKKIIINPDEAKFVHKIFDMGITYSAAQIQKELAALGCNLYLKRIIRIMRNPAYIDHKIDEDGNKYSFPRIISDEQFYAVNRRLDEKPNNRKSHCYNPSAMMITCPVCGGHFVKRNTVYTCYYHHTSFKGTEKYCSNDLSILSDRLDAITVYVTKLCLFADMRKTDDTRRNELEESINTNTAKLNVLNDKVNSFDKKKSKLATMYMDDLYTDEEYRKELARLKSSMQTYHDEIDYLTERIRIDTENLNDYKSFKHTLADELSLAKRVINGNVDKQETYRLSHKYITGIRLREYKAKQKLIEYTTIFGKHYYALKYLNGKLVTFTSPEIETLEKPFEEITYEDMTDIADFDDFSEFV